MMWRLIKLMCVAASVSPTWGQDTCTRTFGIKEVEPVKMDSKYKNITGEIWKISPSVVNIFAIRVTKKTLYCKDNFLATFGTQCQANTRVLRYSQDQLSKMVEKGKCLVGRECSGDECSGTLSDLCNVDNLDRYVSNQGPRQLVKSTKDWYYTCQVTWKCELGKYVQTPTPKTEPLSHWVRGLNGQDIRLMPEKEYYDMDGFQYVISKTTVDHKTKPMECIIKPKTAVCMYNKDPPEYAVIDSNGFGVDMSTVIKVSTRGSSSLTRVNALDVSTQAGLIHVTNELMEDSYKNSYNILLLTVFATKISKVLTTILQAGGIEPGLVKMLNLGNGRLKWEGYNSYQFCSTSKVRIEIPPTKVVKLFTQPTMLLNDINGDLPTDGRERAQSGIELLREAEDLDSRDDSFNHNISGGGAMSGLLYDTFLHLFLMIGSCLGYLSAIVLLIRR